MKKFKFGVTTDVFMQCKIRACAAKPCGTCATRQLTKESRKLQQSSLSPMEGEMFAPAAQIKLGTFDKSALVVDPIQASAPSAAMQSPAPTSKPLTIESDISLPLSPSWAIENRESLTQTLRATLSLRADEDLVITKISAARRMEETRKLQEGGSVKIDFIVGLAQTSRATQAQSALTALSSGQANAVQTFTTQLDSQLQAAGKPVVALSPQAVAFSAPRAETRPQATPAALGSAPSAAWSWTPTAAAQPQQQYNPYIVQQQGVQSASASSKKEDSEIPFLLILTCSAAGLVLFFCALGKCRIVTNEHGSHFAFGGDVQRPQREMPAVVEGDVQYQGKTYPSMDIQ
jgi:hypothetical protein